MQFHELGLSAELLRAVDDQGYKTATPVQQQAIPWVLEGRDVLAGAQTGTGKTAGFTLPLLQRLHRSDTAAGPIRALILTPTRELASQVESSVTAYGRYLKLRSCTVFGGVSINTQIARLRKRVDILVATPGRLLDHLQRGTVDLSRVEFLVLDEADRMLDMGFIRDMRKIFATLPAQRQTLLFSATFSPPIRRLADDLLDSPAQIQVARENGTADGVSQTVHPVDKSRKRALLAHRIAGGDWNQILVFTRTKHGANRLAKQLDAAGHSATAIHGNKSQGARTRALADFKGGHVRVLVATDIAARGLDIERLPCVVNYELPSVPEDYVHRIGRTARAGQQGEAISLVCAEEHGLLRDIERLLDRRLDRKPVAGFEPGTSERDDRVRGRQPAAKTEGGPSRRRRRAGARRPPRNNRASRR